MDSNKSFFITQVTRDVRFRIQELRKLKKILKGNEEELNKAIYVDFKKLAYETYVDELGLLYQEIDYDIKHLKRSPRIKKLRIIFVN